MLEILYEDNHLLVCIKPRGVLSQEDHTKDLDMLTLLKAYLKEKYQKIGNVYLGLVMRLDRNTSGIMVFAKTSKAASRLSEQIRLHEMTKQYLCVVSGILKNSGTLEHYLSKNEEEVKSYVTNKEKGKKAILEYVPLKEVDGNTVVKVNLKTGRHHQIRVQMSAIHHPLLGDSLYGNKNADSFLLHAFTLGFIHPVTKEPLHFVHYPKDEKWKKYLEEKEIEK